MKTKVDVSMSREMVSSVATQREFDLARASVKQSMQRLFPDHRYYGETIYPQGTLTIITFHFRYSWLAKYRDRWNAWIERWTHTGATSDNL
jgi:hypothetical protein